MSYQSSNIISFSRDNGCGFVIGKKIVSIYSRKSSNILIPYNATRQATSADRCFSTISDKSSNIIIALHVHIKVQILNGCSIRIGKQTHIIRTLRPQSSNGVSVTIENSIELIVESSDRLPTLTSPLIFNKLLHVNVCHHLEIHTTLIQVISHLT